MTADLRTPPVGPTAPTARALGPDLARGFMLLFIALANSHYFLRGGSVLGGYPLDGSAVDGAVAWLISTFVDGRAYPMFGLLFGYGVAHIVRRQEGRRPRSGLNPELGAKRPARIEPAAGAEASGASHPAAPRGVRRLLWRRALVLIAVGLVDAMLFFVGDILTAYGVLLLVGAWMVRWKDRWLLLVGILFFVLVSLPGADSLAVSRDGPDGSMLPHASTMFADRLPVALFVALGGPLGFIFPFVVGLLAGRRRILEEPERHRVLLGVTAAVGIGAAVLGAQPVSLIHAGLLDIPDQSTLALVGALHDSTGYLGGFGYAALLALLAVRFQARRGPVVEAIAATGQRSMTCYLMQSPVWALAFTPFLLDLSGTLTVTTTALLATATWTATVIAADRMRRAGYRGPFELLIRRITYGRR